MGLCTSPTDADDHSSYVQFAPVAYTVKLNIELTMAVLISKVVRSVHRVDNQDSSTNYAANTHLNSRIEVMTSTHQPRGYFPGSVVKNAESRAEMGDGHLAASKRESYQGEGIMKTVTMLMTENGESKN